LREQVSRNDGQNNKHLKVRKGQIQFLLEKMLSIHVYVLDNMQIAMAKKKDKI
jgi:hypothetical protein